MRQWAAVTTRTWRSFFAALAAFALVATASTAASAYSFPRVKVLEPNVAFWKRVYAVWSVNDIAFHDDQDFRILYTVKRVPARGKRIDGKTRRQAIKETKAEILAALATLDKKQPKSAEGLSGLEKEIFENLKDVKRADKYRRTSHLRAQNGLRERFRQGYIRAGEFEPEVRAYLKKAGLPEEIVALAYVESLMTVRAVSHAGAQGIWQFMPATGREYMQVHSVLDERHDPVLATIAAAKYLNTARKRVGPWPVAITSYNYGRSGVRRLIKQAGSDDLGVILQKAKSPRFQIAARNYYASFLAVADVLKAPQKYFPGAKQRPPWKYDIVRLPFPMTAKQIVANSSLTKAQLTKLNPALTKKARDGKAVLPMGMALRVPKGKKKTITAGLLSTSKDERVAALSTVGKRHRANGKDTIQKIAKRYKVPAQQVADLNGTTVDAVPKKRARVAIPQRPIRFSMLPSARNVDVPAASPLGPDVRLAKATTVESAPPKAKKSRKRKKKRAPERVKVKLVSVVSLPDPSAEQALLEVDATVGDPAPLPQVDMVVGTEGADAFAVVPAEESDVADEPRPTS